MAKQDIPGEQLSATSDGDRPICGIVRPIAEMGDIYPATHWLEVHDIVAQAAEQAGYQLKLVSESDRSGIIVSEIIQNLYENPIVICDVSGRNPNVMFELGMRITFQKPVIIIKDDVTPFTFDISAIRHVPYRHDLRLQPTLAFRDALAKAISATVESANDPKSRDYLQQFGRIEVTQLTSQQVNVSELAETVREMSRTVSSLAQGFSSSAMSANWKRQSESLSDPLGMPFTQERTSVIYDVDTSKIDAIRSSLKERLKYLPEVTVSPSSSEGRSYLIVHLDSLPRRNNFPGMPSPNFIYTIIKASDPTMRQLK